MTTAPTTRYPFWQVFLTLLIGPVGIGLVGSTVVAGIVAAVLVFADGGVLDVERVQAATLSFPVVATSLAITALGFIAGPVGLAWITRRPIARTLGLAPRPRWLPLLLAPIGTVALGPTSDYLVRFAQRAIPGWTFGALDQIETIARNSPAFLLLPFLAVCPGFGEEIVFRGFLQRWIGRGALAIVVSGLTFAMIHVDPHHVIGVVPLGLYLAWVADRTDSTWPTIVAHVANNSIAVLSVKLAGSTSPDEHATIGMLFGGLAICLATVVAIVATTPYDRPHAE